MASKYLSKSILIRFLEKIGFIYHGSLKSASHLISFLFFNSSPIILIELGGDVVKTYFITRVGILVGIYAINVAGLTLAGRYAGIISLGHAAFFGFGAYISAILTVKLNFNPWISMVIAGLCTMVFAYLFAIPFLRLRRVYLAMATLGLGEVVYLIAKDMGEITGGVMGLAGIPYLSVGNFVFSEDRQIFYLIWFFALFTIFITENIGQTRLGRAYHAIRTNETAAAAMGVDVKWELGRVFCYSALVSALSGSLLAHFLLFISPDLFNLHVSFTILIFVIIGGANVWGGLITAIILIVFSEVFRGFQDFSIGLYGILLILALFIFPEGLAVLFPQKYRKREKDKIKNDDIIDKRMQKIGPINNKIAQGMIGKKILQIDEITMRFGGTTALNFVSGDLYYNQIMGIIGPNGAGKTTLLNVISGFLTPETGRIIFKDKKLMEYEPHMKSKLGIGRTFQISNLFQGMTVIENVMVGSHTKGQCGLLKNGLRTSKAKVEESRIFNTSMESLIFLGLGDKAYRNIDSLPYGEQKLVEIARALAMEPELLILDEPASGLNTKETKQLMNTLLNIKEQGISIIIVEHNMPLIMNVSDKVLVLDFGSRIAFGTPDDIAKNAKVIEAYLGQET